MSPDPTTSFHLSLQAQRQGLRRNCGLINSQNLTRKAGRRHGCSTVKPEVISQMAIPGLKNRFYQAKMAFLSCPLSASHPRSLCQPVRYALLTTALSRCVPSLGPIFPSDFSPSFSHPVKMSIFKVQKNIKIVPMRLQAPAIYRLLLRRGLPKHLHARPCSYEAGRARFIPIL